MSKRSKRKDAERKVAREKANKANPAPTLSAEDQPDPVVSEIHNEQHEPPQIEDDPVMPTPTSAKDHQSDSDKDELMK